MDARRYGTLKEFLVGDVMHTERTDGNRQRIHNTKGTPDSFGPVGHL